MKSVRNMAYVQTKTPQYCVRVSSQSFEQLEAFAQQTLVPASDLSRLRAGGQDNPTS